MQVYRPKISVFAFFLGNSENASERSGDAPVSGVLFQHGFDPDQTGAKNSQVSAHSQRTH